MKWQRKFPIISNFHQYFVSTLKPGNAIKDEQRLIACSIHGRSGPTVLTLPHSTLPKLDWNLRASINNTILSFFFSSPVYISSPFNSLVWKKGRGPALKKPTHVPEDVDEEVKGFMPMVVSSNYRLAESARLLTELPTTLTICLTKITTRMREQAPSWTLSLSTKKYQMFLEDSITAVVESMQDNMCQKQWKEGSEFELQVLYIIQILCRSSHLSRNWALTNRSH